MCKFRQILTELSARDTAIFLFSDDNEKISRDFKQNLVHALILRRSGLGLLMGRNVMFYSEGKRQGCQVVSVPDFDYKVLGLNPTGWIQNLVYDCTMLPCMEHLIIILLSS